MRVLFKNSLIAGFSLLIFISGCVEPYIQAFRTSNKIIIVEGLLTNEAGLNPITIKESLPSTSGGSRIAIIQGAKVSVIINNKTTISLTEKGEGQYHFDATFKGEIGSTYQLKFTAPDGNSYESKIEKLEEVSPIEKIYLQLDLKGIVDAKGKTSAAYNIYLDTNDPAEKANQYLWEWTIYEKQNVCQTCTGGYYYRTPAPNGACVSDALLTRQGNVFDYRCETGCYEIIRSSDLITNSDELYNGKSIKGQFVGKIPIYQYSGALLEMGQYSITKEAYKFIRLSQKQGIETGGLADTPPAALVGNVVCTNDPTINTSGYFIVGAKSVSRFWMDKQDVIDQKIPTVGLLGGRAIKYEPSGASTTRPPAAPCNNSSTRTNKQPLGWIN